MMSKSTLRRAAVPLMAVLLVLSLVACHSSKGGAARGGAAGGGAAAGGSYATRYATLISNYRAWNDVKMPVTLRLKSPTDVTVSGTVYMTRDCSIYMSFRFLGMEVLNLYATGDSVFATYKMKKIYVAESIDRLMGDFPLTVGNVQDMLLGRPFMVGRGTLDASMTRSLDFADGSGNGVYYIAPPAVDGIAYRYEVEATGKSIGSLVVTPKGHGDVACDYAPAVATKVGAVAPEASVTVVTHGLGVDASLEWNLGKAAWNTGEKKTWKMPKGYRRVAATEILKIF